MSVKISIMTIPGAPLAGLNPLPMFHRRKASVVPLSEDSPEYLGENLGSRERILPYMMQDRYTNKLVPMKMKTIVMENDYLKAVFWPESGGKLYSLFDKVNNRELLFANPVYQPRNLAIRSAWLSGGIEFNFGNVGHNYFTCDNVFAAILKDEKGNDFLRMYEFERAKNALYQMDFHLPEDSRVLYSHVKLINPFDTDTTTYWWTNIAVCEDGKTRVLASTDKVLVLGEKLTYEQMPYLSLFEGKDLSYPLNATRSYDHFYQTPDNSISAWEASADKNGNVFFDLSTAPLLYRKMFCWGNHPAAKHWQDYLSIENQGDYVELQAGFARSQIHDAVLKANSTIEWTQCFGGDSMDKAELHQENLQSACDYLGEKIDEIVSEETLFERDREFSLLADKKVEENNIVHLASGWGALEKMRMLLCGEKEFPQSVCFPMNTISKEQYPWYCLLTQGKLPEEIPSNIPLSWMTSKRWRKLLEKSINEGNEDWYSMLNYAVMLYEATDDEHIAVIAQNWEEYPKYTSLARKAFLRSIELEPSVWAYHCLFCIELNEGNEDLAEEYYDKLFELEPSTADYAFADEYIKFLNKRNKFEKAWNLYESLPENIRNVAKVKRSAALSALKLKKLDFLPEIFEKESGDIREGETSLTDIWFEYSALKMAKERGIDENISAEKLDELIDEAWENCPPPKEIDFRMSIVRKNKYRLES